MNIEIRVWPIYFQYVCKLCELFYPLIGFNSEDMSKKRNQIPSEIVAQVYLHLIAHGDKQILFSH